MPVTINQDLKALPPTETILPSFLARFIRARENEILAQCSKDGTTVASLNLDRLKTFEVPVPPLQEQQRIVAKLDRLQARSRATRAALETIPPLLEQFRQSVLAAAFRGDLTADWRAQNPDVEPASVLLDRIRVERRQQWEAAELADMRAKGKEPIGDGWKAKYPEPKQDTTHGLPALPVGWACLTLEGVVPATAPIMYGILQPGPEQDVGVPYVRPTEIVNHTVALDQVRRTTLGIGQRYKRSTLAADDVLLSIVGTIGKVALVPAILHGGNITQSSVRIRALPGAVLPDFLAWFLRSPIATQQYDVLRLGTGVPRLNVGDVRMLRIPIPPVSEQEHMVEVLRRAFSRYDLLNCTTEEALALIPRTEQSILAKAFRGELVPQDPNDEPASVLLERIRAEREAAGGTKRRVRRAGASG